jgi:uncharacterized membrane protein YeaQ/YmgE (transglycosylase-associated protein family)
MSATFAAMVLVPGNIIAWLVVGLIAGWLAGKVMKGRGFGIVVDIIVGLVGSFVGGILLGFLVDGSTGFVGSIIVAFIGACAFIAIMRALSGRGVI